ncbi:MAG: MoxR family ATPase [Schlesneria sp.]
MSNPPIGPIFNPERVQKCDPLETTTNNIAGDTRDGRVYVYQGDEIALAVNVAWATGRPLLVEGLSGCGKSSLAKNVALTLNWRYYEYVVGGRTTAEDLLWRFDSIRRLNDAQAKRLKSDVAYVEPGVLWWAFDPENARAISQNKTSTESQRWNDSDDAVVLIDEIDKADIDVPNNLLVPLGSLQFSIPNSSKTIFAKRRPLIFITTNGERELPGAFLRRCVRLRLPSPDAGLLISVAKATIADDKQDESLFEDIARIVTERQPAYVNVEPSRGISTAEYLDIVHACLEVGIRPNEKRFEQLVAIVLHLDLSKRDKDQE